MKLRKRNASEAFMIAKALDHHEVLFLVQNKSKAMVIITVTERNVSW